MEQKQPSSFRYPHGLHQFLNQKDQLLFCDVKDPVKFDPVAPNTEKFVCVETYGGVRRVTPELWCEAMASFRPDWCASPADVIAAKEQVKLKRITKAVDRTLRWLDTCLSKCKVVTSP